MCTYYFQKYISKLSIFIDKLATLAQIDWIGSAVAVAMADCCELFFID